MATVMKREWTHAGVKKSAWIVRYNDQNEIKRQKTFDKKKDADKFKTQVEADKREGVVIGGDPITVQAIADQYLNAYEVMKRDGRIAEGTFRKERFYFDRHICPKIGKVKLTELTKNHADRFIVGLRDGDKLRGQGPLQPASIKQITQALARGIDFALRRGLVAKNVVREVGKWSEHRRGKNPVIRTFDISQVKILLVSIETRRWEQHRRSAALTKAAVYLAAFCGLRLGEVLGLTRACVDFDARLIRVRHSLDAWDNLKSPKTAAGRRDVPMPRPLYNALRAWEAFALPERRGLLFRTKSAGQIATNGFHRNYWQPALHQAGLAPAPGQDRFHFHALRHFAASMMIVNHIPLPDVASLLGHASFDMTLQVYAHPIIGGDRRHVALERMTTDLLTVA